VNAWLTDVATGQFVEAGSSPSSRNLAADNATGRVFAAGSRLRTFQAGDDGQLTEVSSELIVDANGTPFAAPTRFQSLGFANGLLYGSVAGGNSVPRGFYAMDPETSVATLLAPLGDISVFPGLDYNPEDGLLYAIEGGNTDASIVSIDIATLEVTHVADVPLINAGGASIIYDGVAVGNGKVYLSNGNRVSFTFTPILVYNIASGTFEDSLPSPPKSREQGFYNSGATFFAPRGASEREVQIRSVDFDAGVIELFNFSSIDFDLSGWRFCSHDFDQARRYTAAAGFGGVTIESDTSVFIHFNNDAPANDPDRINRSTLGGAFASPLDQDAYALQLFNPDTNGNVSFGNSSLIADHVQWNVNGSGVGSAETRTAQAVSEQLWSANGDFVATEADSDAIVLTDLSGDIQGAPAEYAVLRNNTIHNETVDGDLADDPNAPSALAFELGSNVVEGRVNLSNDTANGDRDFITLSVPAGQALTGLTLLNWDPNNIGFIAVNAGSTGFVPSGATNAQFLAGVLVDTSNEEDNLLSNFVSQSVTQNSLSAAELTEGDYTFVIQQTSDLTQDYALDFVLTEVDAPCLADVNGNGVADPGDFNAWVIAFSTQAPECDQNGDGLCNPADFNAWIVNFNAGCD
ncbi:MAG: GC-type dockerin domain-anchored protein, partial [Planctomycetota bacterium]